MVLPVPGAFFSDDPPLAAFLGFLVATILPTIGCPRTFSFFLSIAAVLVSSSAPSLPSSPFPSPRASLSSVSSLLNSSSRRQLSTKSFVLRVAISRSWRVDADAAIACLCSRSWSILCRQDDALSLMRPSHSFLLVAALALALSSELAATMTDAPFSCCWRSWQRNRNRSGAGRGGRGRHVADRASCSILREVGHRPLPVNEDIFYSACRCADLLIYYDRTLKNKNL